MLRKCFWKQLDLKSTYLTGQETHLSAQHNGSGWICLLVGETRSWGKGVWSGGPGPGRCKLYLDGTLLSVTEQGGGSCQLAFLSHSRNVTAWRLSRGRRTLGTWMDGWNTGREREGQGGQGMLGPPASRSADLGRGPVVHFNQFLPTLKITKIVTD